MRNLVLFPIPRIFAVIRVNATRRRLSAPANTGHMQGVIAAKGAGQRFLEKFDMRAFEKRYERHARGH